MDFCCGSSVSRFRSSCSSGFSAALADQEPGWHSPGARPEARLEARDGKVARFEVDKSAKQVRGYDGGGRLLVVYPTTIGSEENPSPSGIAKVRAIAPNLPSISRRKPAL